MPGIAPLGISPEELPTEFTAASWRSITLPTPPAFRNP